MKLEPGILSWHSCAVLADVIRQEDLLECSGKPFDALLLGMRSGGDCWTCVAQPDDHVAYPRLLGAFGYTDHGTIWSLWRDLSTRESLAILRHTPLWVRTMLEASGREFLFNFVHVDNHPAVGWLHKSNCFLIDYAHPVQLNGALKLAYAFQTKPLEDLPSV